MTASPKKAGNVKRQRNGAFARRHVVVDKGRQQQKGHGVHDGGNAHAHRRGQILAAVASHQLPEAAQLADADGLFQV
jgi:hypothetical protein